jgi:putative FmdB family regulatory protein
VARRAQLVYDREVPIYEYLCEGCGRVSEVIQKLAEPPPRACPDCGSSHIAKLVSRSAFQLKGGGWYADLYASTSKDSKKPEKGEKTDKDKAGKAEAKPPATGGADKPAPAAEKPAVSAKPAPGKAES